MLPRVPGVIKSLNPEEERNLGVGGRVGVDGIRVGRGGWLRHYSLVVLKFFPPGICSFHCLWSFYSSLSLQEWGKGGPSGALPVVE